MTYHQLFAAVNEKNLKKFMLGMKDPSVPVICAFTYNDMMAWEQGALGNVMLLLTERQAKQLDGALNAECGLSLGFSPAQLRAMAKIETNVHRIRGQKVEPRTIRAAPGFVSIGFCPPAGPKQQEEVDDTDDNIEDPQPMPAKTQPIDIKQKKKPARKSNFPQK